MTADFSSNQKRWLEGFVSGAAAVRGLAGTTPAGATAEPPGPDAPLLAAQDNFTRAGRKLVDQEKWKRAEHPMDGGGLRIPTKPPGYNGIMPPGIPG